MDGLEGLLGSGQPARLGLRVTDFVSTLGGIAAILLVVFIVGLVARRGLAAAAARDRLDSTAATFIGAVVRYMLASIAIVGILGELGVDTASLLGSLGIVGLTIGFAARDALSNIISGLFILWDRPFTIGDLIEIDGKYGRVDRITMRSTRVVTPDGKMLAIPNSAVVNTTVASYTNFPHLRLDIAITVGVEENLSRVRAVLLEMVAQHAELLSEPAPRVAVLALNDYNVALELQAWLDDEKNHIVARQDLREAAFEALRDAKVHMPYQTIELAPRKSGEPAVVS